MPARLLLVRHGQTSWNCDGRFMGQMDIPMDDTGERQAEAVARRLRLERPEAIYTSDLSRALNTAQAIREAIGESVSPAQLPRLIVEPRLREMHFGEWQGMTYTEIKTSQPETLAEWETDLVHIAPPGGESFAQTTERIKAVLDEIKTDHPDGTTLLVAHGGALQSLICLALGISIDRFWQFSMNNTGLSELNIYPAGGVLIRFNDICHLEGVH
jgi:2,3-bisphosphoglycerate-dependent phosphoglycerate mutase